MKNIDKSDGTEKSIAHKQYKVMLIDENPLIYLGIEKLLENESIKESICLLKKNKINDLYELEERIDLLIIDLPTFIHATSSFTKTIIEMNINVVITNFQSKKVDIDKIFSIDLKGYFGVGMSTQEILSALKEIAAGNVYFHHSLSQDLIERYLELYNGDIVSGTINNWKIHEHDLITKREFEIIQLLVAGFNNEKIAKHMGVSDKTIKNHLSSIFKKLNLDNRTQVAIKAIQEKWVLV